MQEPFQSLDDCQGNHYKVQLNGYAYLLEKYYGLKVVGMYVVCTHPDNGTAAFVDRVPFMKAQVERMMEYQRCRARELRCMASHDTR